MTTHDAVNKPAHETDDKLIAFALEVLRRWHGDGARGDIDGGDLQDIAVKAGVCTPEFRTTPCSEMCPCSDFTYNGEQTECCPIAADVFARMRA